jgi:hypothetical protein
MIGFNLVEIRWIMAIIKGHFRTFEKKVAGGSYTRVRASSNFEFVRVGGPIPTCKPE